MNVKLIVESWLKAHGYDGLCNVDVPCGCLIGELAPCGEDFEYCQPGHREDVDEHATCGCDGQGTKHWHVYVIDFVDPVRDADEWVCDCGERCVPSSAQWRWNGRDWEHHHGYPIGHVTATRRPATIPKCGEG